MDDHAAVAAIAACFRTGRPPADSDWIAAMDTRIDRTLASQQVD